jgi:hypothetical protein
MELKIEMKRQLEQLLAKPAKATQNDIPLLQELIATYPYYQPLYLLLAKAAEDTTKQQEVFTKAALYNNGRILHRLIYTPQQITVLQNVETIQYPIWKKAELSATEEPMSATSNEKEVSLVEQVPEIENLPPLIHETIDFKAPDDAGQTDNELVENLAGAEQTDDSERTDNAKHTETDESVEKNSIDSTDDFPFPEIENIEQLQSEVIAICDSPSPADDGATPETDEQETFDEINELVLPTDFVATQAEEIKKLASEEPKEEQNSLETDFKAETFASIDFFAFDLGSTITEEAEVKEPESTEEQTAAEIASETIEPVVSKYDDDKLPFTFLWWLAKTRKDHEQIFRPFVNASKGLAPAQHLQQQYVENIFHLQAPFELDNEQDKIIAPKNTKESEIIESFIKNDPQIKALPPNQINTENKAKKSAEDGNDLVSETLAQIYIEQMLYHKAIDTYQKLSLKFPEKSGYFADLIQSLEKKI